jgi:hypothetical protein
MDKDEQGSALIWFVFLVALLCLVSLTLGASVHQYLFARELIDFSEQFAVALKTRLQSTPNASVSSIGNLLLQEVAPHYSFPQLQLKQLSLEEGETVRVIFCAKWDSPVTAVNAARTICEGALAR